MKRISLVTLLFACCFVVAAQPSRAAHAQEKDKMKSEKMAKKMTIIGCISEKDGKYLLTNKEHPGGIELTSSEDLKPHVGHQVKVTGTPEKAPMMAGDMKSDGKMKPDDAMKSGDGMKADDKMKHDDMPMMAVKVTGLKMVSDHCAMEKMSK
jgi:hypothetical protein